MAPPRKPEPTERQIRAALIAYGEAQPGWQDRVITALDLPDHFDRGEIKPKLQAWLDQYGVKRGCGVPPAVLALGGAEAAKTAQHIEDYKRARRGFHLPAAAEADYVAFLKQGCSIDEARRRAMAGLRVVA